MDKAKIMIVEDEGLVGLDIQNTLQDLGYNTTSVFAEARRALEYLHRETVDIILMDINLRGEMDGIDAAEQVKERFGIPVLFLTAFANSEVIQRARSVGAYGYLLKPFKARELEAMVEVALCKHRADAERTVLEKRMQRAEKYESLRVMAGGVAHQFNNSLHAVLGNLSFALEELPRESPARFSLIEAEKSAWKAAELSKQMLAFSGHGFAKTTELDLTVFIGQLKHLLRALLPSSVILEFDLAHRLPLIQADPGQLKQIVIALIINAIEAIGEKSGMITVRTSLMECDRDYLMPLRLGKFLEEGTYVFLEITDTGYGMDSDTIQKVFDPFFSTKFTGRGLGLPSSLGLVQAHNGTIRISSESGLGTSVKVLLPAIEDEHLADSIRRAGDAPAWKGSGTILLVDNEEVVRSISGTMLERVGFKVLTAVNGIDAVDIFSRNSEDIVCVLLDLTMPGMGGKEVLRELRKVQPSVKVILCSGYSEEEAILSFQQGDLAGFLQKPYGFDSMVNRIRKAIDH